MNEQDQLIGKISSIYYRPLRFIRSHWTQHKDYSTISEDYPVTRKGLMKTWKRMIFSAQWKAVIEKRERIEYVIQESINQDNIRESNEETDESDVSQEKDGKKLSGLIEEFNASLEQYRLDHGTSPEPIFPKSYFPNRNIVEDKNFSDDINPYCAFCGDEIYRNNANGKGFSKYLRSSPIQDFFGGLGETVYVCPKVVCDIASLADTEWLKMRKAGIQLKKMELGINLLKDLK